MASFRPLQHFDYGLNHLRQNLDSESISTTAPFRLRQYFDYGDISTMAAFRLWPQNNYGILSTTTVFQLQQHVYHSMATFLQWHIFIYTTPTPSFTSFWLQQHFDKGFLLTKGFLLSISRTTTFFQLQQHFDNNTASFWVRQHFNLSISPTRPYFGLQKNFE